jgi:hypothetical protein
MSLSRVSRSDRLATQRVLAVGDDLEMVRIDTSRVTTQMVDHESGGNGLDDKPIDGAVSTMITPLMANASVSLGVKTDRHRKTLAIKVPFLGDPMERRRGLRHSRILFVWGAP